MIQQQTMLLLRTKVVTISYVVIIYASASSELLSQGGVLRLHARCLTNYSEWYRYHINTL